MTLIVSTELSPRDRAGIASVTDWPETLADPSPATEVETMEKLGSTTSVATTLVASSAPLFVTVTVKARGEPLVAGSDETV